MQSLFGVFFAVVNFARMRRTRKALPLLVNVIADLCLAFFLTFPALDGFVMVVFRQGVECYPAGRRNCEVFRLAKTIVYAVGFAVALTGA